MSVSVHLKHGSGLSVRDKSGWLSIEGADVPYILRESKEKFVPVKIVEKYILQYYPSTYPKEVAERPPLVCHHMKNDEVSLLNKCCRQQNCPEQFTKSDPVVKLCDFLDFFGLVKEAYPNVVLGNKTPVTVTNNSPPPAAPAGVAVTQGTDYGWLLMKDALVPYVLRGKTKYAPLNVIRGAAQLLLGVQVESTCATEPEVLCLNDMCRKVGLVFTFQKNTSLANLKVVRQMCPGCPVQDLPKENPMDFVNAVRQATDANSGPSTGAAYRPPPPLQAMSNGQKHVTSDQQSATRSLQALAQMAKGQGQLVFEEEEEDCVVISDGPQGASRGSLTKAPVSKGGKTVRSTKLSPVTNRSASSSPGLTITETKSLKASANVIIKPMDCLGKTISCLLRGKTGVSYALVEAVCRVYFPNCSLVDFIHFLELELAVTLYILKKAEEEAFIEFYGIPTKQLRCNQVIKLQDLRDRMGWLQKRFGGIDGSSEEGQSSKNEMTERERLAARSPPGNKNGVINGDIVSMAASDILATCGLTDMAMDQEDIDVGDASISGENVNGKNKSLEHTIMRILQDKKDVNEETKSNGDDTKTKEPAPTEEEYKPDDSEYYPELGDMATQAQRESSPEAAQSPQGDVDAQQKGSSTNKRKGAPPRRCFAPVEKKMTMLVDGVKVEKQDTFTEDSDMEEYA